MAAGYIGTDYAWGNYGWSVVRPKGTNELKAGSMANIKPNNAFQGTGPYGHVSIIIANNGGTVTVLEQNYAGRQYVVQNTYNAQAYLGAIETLCYPPELKEGKTVEGTPVAGANVPVPDADKKETPTVATEVVIDPKKTQEWRNDDGIVEFYLRGSLLYAPISKRLYPSVLTGTETNDNWIRKDMEVETDSEEVLISTALRELRKHCYPAVTYEAEGYFDLDIGDTIKIQDTGFSPMLILEARVSEQQISFSNPSENKTVFANYQALKNKVSDSLMSRMAKLEKNGKVYEPIIFYKKGGSIIGSGSQLLVRATDFVGTLPITVEAYLNDELVATAEVTFNNVVDGKTQYTHIAYANSADGRVDFSTNLSDRAYIGMYVDFNSRDSLNPSDYTWTLVKGANGGPGEKGADGRTPYIHFAYAESADGRTGFSTTKTDNKRYIGTYTDYTQEDSTDPTKYKWVDMVGNVYGGTRNLVQYGAYPDNNHKFWSNTELFKHPFYENSESTMYVLWNNQPYPSKTTTSSNRFKVKRNTNYKFSFCGFAHWFLHSFDVHFLGRKKGETAEFTITNQVIKEGKVSPDGVKYFDVSFNSGNVDEGYIRISNNGTTRADRANAGLFFTEVCVYEGNISRPWSRSLEETDAIIDSKADNQLTQEQLNALSERAQINEAELKAKASMEALSALEKAYNSFVKANADAKVKSEQDLVEAGRRIELLTTQFGGMAELKTFIDTYMKSTNEGLIIGKNDASSTIKVSSDRISMFSAGKEVMYISQGVINIDNGIFTASVRIGRFRTEQYHLNPDMNVIRYVG